jgi:hypothetical protein
MATLNGLTINGTFIKLPIGTTAQRPANTEGRIRLNRNFEEQYTNAGWQGSETIITDGLQCYLDAGNPRSYATSINSPVNGTRWFDLSGNNRHFDWVNPPILRRSGSISWFQTSGNRCNGPASNSFNLVKDYTMFVVFQTKSGSGNAGVHFYTTNTRVSGARAIFFHPGWVNNTVYFDGDAGGVGQRVEFTFNSQIFFNWTVWCFRVGDNVRGLYNNGILYASNASTQSPITLGTAAVDLASDFDYGGNSSNWNGRLNAFLIYNRGLTTAEIQTTTRILLRNIGA